MTHTKKMKTQYANQRMAIELLLDWTPEQYAYYQEQEGYNYLRQVLCLNVWDVKCMSYEAMFWKWWINMWNLMDDNYVITLLMNSHTPEQLYLEAHKAQYITASPMAVQFDNTYANMIGQLTDNLIK
jgi:hypothetical protein